MFILKKSNYGLWAAIATVILVLGFCFNLIGSANAEEGLVLHYTFGEGSGSVVYDKSGHGNDGKIQGAAEWVKEKTYGALRFNGTDNWIECGTNASLELTKEGTLEAWCLPDAVQGGFISWHTGSRWGDERLVFGFVTYGDIRLLACVADGQQFQLLREPLETGKWYHLVFTFDGATLKIYKDGDLLYQEAQSVSPDVKGVPLRIGAVDGLGKPYFQGLMREVRVYNKALSAKDISAHFLSGAKAMGLAVVPNIQLTPHLYAKSGELVVEADLTKLEKIPAGSFVEMELRNAEKQEYRQKAKKDIPQKAETIKVSFATDRLSAGDYYIRCILRDHAGIQIGGEFTVKYYFPKAAQLSGMPAGTKILNNLVTELLNLRSLSAKPYQEVSFTNPRDGWVFVSSTAGAKIGLSVRISIDAGKEAAIIIQDAAGTKEAMRHIPAGEHKLRIWSEANVDGKQALLNNLIVRAVPAMMYCAYPAGSRAGYGNYDWKFLEKDVLPNINTIVGGVGTPLSEQKTWKECGGQWYLEQNLPTLIRGELKDVPTPLTGDYAYNYWTKSTGFTNPYLDGVMADEFIPSDSPDLLGYTEAIKRIAQNKEFKSKAIYAWCAPMYASSLGRDFCRTVIDSGYKLAAEVYLPEEATEKAANDSLYNNARRNMQNWEKAFPGVAEKMIFVLGILSAPPESLNVNPQVDYKVWLDMQYSYLANAPECFGLYGVMVYKSHYAEEEAIRWAGRLFRHYCIEGNTDLLSARYGYKYILDHIQNADFDNGLAGWTISEAEPKSVQAGGMKSLGRLLSRWPSIYGNHCLVMKRCAGRPNRVSQEIKNLKPGKLYSLKVITADYQDISGGKSESKRLAVSIDIENGEIIPEKSFVSDIQGMVSVGSFEGKPAPWMNHHRIVFRAKGSSGRLTLSDWTSDKEPGGPTGQEVMLNFVELQPYFEE